MDVSGGARVRDEFYMGRFKARAGQRQRGYDIRVLRIGARGLAGVAGKYACWRVECVEVNDLLGRAALPSGWRFGALIGNR